MLTRYLVATSLLILTAIGCGDSDSDAPEPFSCEPRPASEVEDCVIEAGERVGDTRYIRTQDDLDAICESKCSHFEGGLVLQNLPGITDLTALQNVRTFESLAITETEDLTSLSGLSNANFEYEEGKFGGLTVRGNESLTTLEGINFPAVVDGSQTEIAVPPSISIVANESLQSLEGLEQIEETRNVDWQITDNFVLESLDGLQNLTTVTGVNITVDRNPELQRIELDALTNAGGLSVNFNESLTRLSLPNLEAIEFLTVTENESLPACQIDDIEMNAQIGKVTNTGNDLNTTCD
jgi:hypothetical protein